MQNNIFYGVVESRDSDPKKLGRCKVRIVGIHTEDNVLLATKDLPWAYPLMPVNSASMSGIGFSPTGVVEGTWVAVNFRDEHQQHPVIIGTVGGIPEDEEQKTETTITYTVVGQEPVKDSSGNIVVDSSGQPVLGGPVKNIQVTEVTLPPTDIKKPSSLTISAQGIQFLKGHEALSSLVKGRNVFTKKIVDPNTPIFSYQDSGGVWTIGYGTTFLTDGSRVGPDTVILAKDATTLLNHHVTTQIEVSLKKKLVAPVTQQMYDALVCIAYNTGTGALLNSDVFSSVNTGKYKDAAALIPFFRNTVKGVVNTGLTNRRLDEQALFMSGGIPNSSFTDVEKDEASPVPNTTIEASTNGLTPSVTVVTTTNDANGFKDPKGKYPTKTLKGEPDTHRLARHDRIYESVVFAKEAGRAKNIRKAFWTKRKLVWSQPEIPYNAKYPFNHTRVTESGHIEEWDDTADCERIHTYHKAGTYSEIDRNGTRVNRIIGDGYEIFERDSNIVIKGTCNVTILGDSNIRVENDAFLEVLGDMNTRVTGKIVYESKNDIEFKTEASIKFKAFEDLKFEINGDIRVGATKGINVIAGEDLTIGSKANVNIGADGIINETASRINLGSGGSSGEPPIKPLPEEWEEKSGLPEFGELVVITRTAGDSTNYESPSEGDSTVYRTQEIFRGDVNPLDFPDTAIEPKEIATPTPPDGTKPIFDEGCGNLGEISTSMQLSPNYTLIKLLGSAGKLPVAQNGRTAEQIVCNLKYIANNVLEPVKVRFPNMVVTSGWRSNESNKGLVGASKKSDHLLGAAVDMQFTGFSAAKVFETAKIIQSMLSDYNQILMEYRGNSYWIHVAVYCPESKMKNARRIGTLDVLPKKFTEGSFVLLR
jgi:GH24 family phage-related lysozyme (muramidase)